jgi:hypothetical protein
MRVNKLLIFFLSLVLCLGVGFLFVTNKTRRNESSTKIKLLKELNFKPHKSKLTLDENSATSENREASELVSSNVISYQQRVDEVIYEGLEFRLGETKNDIINNLGEPLEIIEKSVTSRLRFDLNDKLYDLIYEGFEARIYHAIADEKELVLRILIKHDKYKVKYGLNIGVSEEFVQEVLGPPAIKQDNLYEYYDSNGFAKLRFYFKDSSLTMIEWSFEEN